MYKMLSATFILINKVVKLIEQMGDSYYMRLYINISVFSNLIACNVWLSAPCFLMFVEMFCLMCLFSFAAVPVCNQVSMCRKGSQFIGNTMIVTIWDQSSMGIKSGVKL